MVETNRTYINQYGIPLNPDIVDWPEECRRWILAPRQRRCLVKILNCVYPALSFPCLIEWMFERSGRFKFWNKERCFEFVTIRYFAILGVLTHLILFFLCWCDQVRRKKVVLRRQRMALDIPEPIEMGVLATASAAGSDSASRSQSDPQPNSQSSSDYPPDSQSDSPPISQTDSQPNSQPSSQLDSQPDSQPDSDLAPLLWTEHTPPEELRFDIISGAYEGGTSTPDTIVSAPF